MKSPQRLLLVQRRAGKKRLTQVLGAVVAVFAIVLLSASYVDPSVRNRFVHVIVSTTASTEGPATRRIVQEGGVSAGSGAGRPLDSGGAFLLEGSFGEDPADGDGEDGDGSLDTAAPAAPLPGDTGATFKGACQRLTPPQVPDLVVKKIWRSEKPRAPTDITLVTQVSIDRLYSALGNQCANWGGVISAAVYVPLVDLAVVSSDRRLSGAPLSAPIKIIDDFFNKQEKEGRCKMDIMYIYEELESTEQVGLYPVNALRNRALQLASTELVLLLDADFVPNTQICEDLADPGQYELIRRATANHQAIVLPALEVMVQGEEGQRLAVKAAEDKENVRRMMRNDRLQGFHMDGFVNGHRATDFERWMDANVAYQVNYEEGFEPYIIMQRSLAPWYDERFKGYRKNKVVHLMHLHNLGITFVVTPKGWVVHVPHKEANTWQVTKETGYWKKLKRLYNTIVQQMHEDTFVPATAFRCHDREMAKWSWYK